MASLTRMMNSYLGCLQYKQTVSQKVGAYTSYVTLDLHHLILKASNTVSSLRRHYGLENGVNATFWFISTPHHPINCFAESQARAHPETIMRSGLCFLIFSKVPNFYFDLYKWSIKPKGWDWVG